MCVYYSKNHTLQFFFEYHYAGHRQTEIWGRTGKGRERKTRQTWGKLPSTLIYKLVRDGMCRLYNSTFIVNIILIFVKADRHRRMKGIAVEEEEEKKRVHFSADDLNDK